MLARELGKFYGAIKAEEGREGRGLFGTTTASTPSAFGEGLTEARRVWRVIEGR